MELGQEFAEKKESAREDGRGAAGTRLWELLALESKQDMRRSRSRLRGNGRDPRFGFKAPQAYTHCLRSAQFSTLRSTNRFY